MRQGYEWASTGGCKALGCELGLLDCELDIPPLIGQVHGVNVRPLKPVPVDQARSQRLLVHCDSH